MSANKLTVARVLERLIEMARTDMTPDGHAEAIQIAYQLGVNEGRVLGAEQMGEEMSRAVDASFGRLIEQFSPRKTP